MPGALGVVEHGEEEVPAPLREVVLGEASLRLDASQEIVAQRAERLCGPRNAIAGTYRIIAEAGVTRPRAPVARSRRRRRDPGRAYPVDELHPVQIGRERHLRRVDDRDPAPCPAERDPERLQAQMLGEEKPGLVGARRI
jgi:hypothetical protein